MGIEKLFTESIDLDPRIPEVINKRFWDLFETVKETKKEVTMNDLVRRIELLEEIVGRLSSQIKSTQLTLKIRNSVPEWNDD